jgi:hypothetical protein
MPVMTKKKSSGSNSAATKPRVANYPAAKIVRGCTVKFTGNGKTIRVGEFTQSEVISLVKMWPSLCVKNGLGNYTLTIHAEVEATNSTKLANRR